MTAQCIFIKEKIKYVGYNYRTGTGGEDIHLGYEVNKSGYTYKFKDNKLVREWRSKDDLPAHFRGTFSKEELLSMDFFDCEIELENKKTFNIKDYLI